MCYLYFIILYNSRVSIKVKRCLLLENFKNSNLIVESIHCSNQSYVWDVKMFPNIKCGPYLFDIAIIY